jgi:hypothetical protein
MADIVLQSHSPIGLNKPAVTILVGNDVHAKELEVSGAALMPHEGRGGLRNGLPDGGNLQVDLQRGTSTNSNTIITRIYTHLWIRIDQIDWYLPRVVGEALVDR